MASKEFSPAPTIGALERINASKTFARAERHRSLLRYLVEQAVAGKAEEIKEYTVALEVFGRGSYDPKVDSQVRVEIVKLRERLEKYYAGEGQNETLRIEIPKGSYVPVFREAQPDSSAETMVASQTKPPVPPAVRRLHRAWPWGLGILAAAAISVFIMRTPSRPPIPAFKPSIAVLPFDDLSPAKDQEYFCSGIALELIDDLNALQIFQVLPRSSVARYKGKAADARKVGEELNVHAIVEGSVRKDDKGVRVSVQLIDTREGFQLWRQTYDRDLRNILGIQREIAESIARSFHLDLPATRRALVRREPRNSEAYLHYLRAAYYYGSDIERSLEFYRAAVTTDPGYALAWAGLASAWNRMVDWDVVPVAKARPEGLGAATKAVALDPQLADAQHALGVAKLLYNRDWAGAEQALQKAVELDPMDGDHRWEYARLILVPTGRFGESADLMRKAIALEPWKVALHDQLASSLVRGRQYEAALQAVESARKVSSKAPSPIMVQGMVAASQGRYEEALRLFEEAAKLRRSPWVLAHLGFTWGKLGRTDQARAVMVDLEKGAKDGSLPEFELAVIHAGLGEKEQAVAGLERSIAGYAHSALWMSVDYRLDDLRDHPRYAGLLRAIGLSR